MRILKIFCIIILICLTGCASTPSNKTKNTLVWWVDSLFINENNWIKKDELLKDKQVIENEYTREFNKLLKEKNFNYEVKFKYMDVSKSLDNITDKVTHVYIENNSEEQFDIFSSFDNDYENMADLSSYMINNKVMKSFYESMPESYWKTQMVNGKNLYIPRICINGYQNAFIYNDEMANTSQINVQEIQGYDQLKDAMQKVYDTYSGEIIPFFNRDIVEANFFSDIYHSLNISASQFIKLTKEDNKWKIVNLCKTNEFKEMMKWNEELNKQHLTGLDFSEAELQKALSKGTFVKVGRYYPLEKLGEYEAYQGHTQVPFGQLQSIRVGGLSVYKNSKI